MMEADADEFGGPTENSALKALVAERIQRQGPITFRDFMELALYHPQHGYYSSPGPKMGRQGDYLTSPEVHPVFGHLLAKQVWQLWQMMGAPSPFTLVEMGGGRGLLCRDLLRWAAARAPDFHEALHYCLVERSNALRQEARWHLHQAGIPPGKVAWQRRTPQGIVGCFLSNELLDSFPVHRVVLVGGELREIYVGWAEGRFAEALGPPSTPALGRYFRRLGLLPGEGCRAEVNLEALRWLRAVARALARGFAITFDYGYPAADLYAPWRRDGTLLSFYRHTASADPFARLGRQDMTAHVDFTSLVECGRRWGLEPLPLTSQAEFLSALGIGAGLRPARAEGQIDLEEYYARRRAVLELTDPAGLGRIKVLLQAKGVDSRQGLWCLQESANSQERDHDH